MQRTPCSAGTPASRRARARRRSRSRARWPHRRTRGRGRWRRRSLRGDERPQPVGLDADAPARFVGRDHRRVADLPAEFPVDRRGVAGGSMQQMNEAARGDLQAEPRPQQAGDLAQRHAPLGVQLDDERGEAGTELHRGRPERVGCLEAVPPLHALPALRAAADLDVEAAHDGAHPGEFFLLLRGDAGHFDGAAAVGTRRRRRRPVGLVDLRRAASGTLPAVLRPGPSAGPLAGPLRPPPGKGCSLPFAGAAGLIELFLEVPRCVASSGLGRDGCGPGPGWCGLNRRSAWRSPAEASRCACPANPASRRGAPEPLRPPFSPTMLHVSAHAPRRCTPLHGFSRLYPLTKDMTYCLLAGRYTIFQAAPQRHAPRG